MMPLVDLELRLATRSVAKRISRGRRDPSEDPPWAEGYPLEGDRRACVAYLSQLPVFGGSARSNPFGYYLILLEGTVVGGIGFHGPPRQGVVEVGYGVVPSARGQGVATEALRRLIGVAGELGGVKTVCGRTSADNLASQGVMLGVGMSYVGRDPDFLHYELELGR
jgi:GNAT superfamily N-acetyltransferase